MAEPDPEPKPTLDSVEAKLTAIRKRRAPPKRRGGSRFQGSEIAWRMVIDLSAGIAVGLAIGWGLDGLFGTRPLLMIVFVLLGFAAGVRVMMQSAADLQRRQAAEKVYGASAPDQKGASAPDQKGASAQDRKGASAPGKNEGR